MPVSDHTDSIQDQINLIAAGSVPAISASNLLTGGIDAIGIGIILVVRRIDGGRDRDDPSRDHGISIRDQIDLIGAGDRSDP